MIDAKEMRIGNKVHSPYHNLLFATVDGLLPNNNLVILKEVSTYDTFGNIVPIPLTPELLEACGFVKSNPRLMPGFVLMRSLSFDKYRRFRWDSSDGLSIETVESGWIWNLQEIRCLHQFQNLVHALTNTDLEVNLNKEKV